MWLSDKDIEELKKELAGVHEVNFTRRQKIDDEIATLYARTQAKLEWAQRNGDKIRSSYLELTAAFDSGDAEAVSHQLYRLGDLAPAVLSIPAVDPSGNRLHFRDWAKSAFDEPAQQRMIGLKIDKALEAPMTPSFEEITATGKTRRTEYKEAELTIKGRMTGAYKEEMQKAINDARWEGSYKAENLREQYRAKQNADERVISNAFSVLAQETLMLTSLIRMEEALEAPAAQTATIFKNLLPFLKEKYGAAETLAWLFGEDSDGDNRVMRLLARKDKSLHDPGHPIHAVLDTIPGQFKAAGILRTLAAKTGDETLAQQLEESAAKKAGDYVRLSPALVLNPYSTGAIILGSDKITLMQEGAPANYSVKIEDAESLAAHLGSLPGFWREKDRREIINEKAITRAEIKQHKDGNVRLLIYCHDRLVVEMPMQQSQAQAHVDRLAQDQRFLRTAEGALIDTTRATHAWVTHPKDGSFAYEVRFVRNGQIFSAGKRTLPEQAEADLNRFAQDARMIYLNEKEIVDTAAIGNAWIAVSEKPGTQKLKYVLSGSKEPYYTTLEDSHAAAILRDLVRKAGHVAAGKTETINPAACTLIYYDENKGALVYAVGNTLSETKMTREDGEKMLATIEQDVPGFVRHQRMGLLAPGKVERIIYDSDDGALRYVTGSTSWRSICAPEAGRRAIEAAARNPDFIKITPQAYVRRDAAAIFGWDRSSNRMYWCLSGGTDDKFRPRLTDGEAYRFLSALEQEGRERALNRVTQKYQQKSSEAALPAHLPTPRPIDRPAATAPAPAAASDPPPDTAPRPKGPDLSLPDVFNSRKDREEAAGKPAPQKDPETAPAGDARSPAPRLSDLKI